MTARGVDVKVFIPGPLLSYTSRREVDADGSNLTELLDDLDRQFPGIRFRVVDERNLMRAHVRFFVNGEQTFSVEHPLKPSDTVHLIAALSGG